MQNMAFECSAALGEWIINLGEAANTYSTTIFQDTRRGLLRADGQRDESVWDKAQGTDAPNADKHATRNLDIMTSLNPFTASLSRACRPAHTREMFV